MDVKKGDSVTDVYGNQGTVVDVFYDYVRLNTGKHVYKLAIASVN
ncbi:hypothetical protein [Brevibacillus sp. DP1.3A]|nr:hypothetical protein [Brevibacillus sp. DP1.3A]